MRFANHPVVRALLTLLFAAVVWCYGWVIGTFAAAAVRLNNAWPVWGLAAALALFVLIALVRHVAWHQKYYYFWKLRRNLSGWLQDSSLVELRRGDTTVTVTRTALSDVYVVAVDDEGYEIGPEDVSFIIKRTLIEVVKLPNGTTGKVDRPIRQFFVPDRRRLFRHLYRLIS